jgi:heme/copper-type cytochrome/quinol oxidase subunit 3
MPGEATARKLVESTLEKVEAKSSFGGGPPSSFETFPISNARLGLLMFLGAEVMFFAGLIGAFLVFRLGSEIWPPPTQPRLPALVTGINTIVLLGSGLTVHLALRAIRAGLVGGLFRWLLITAILGVVFLSVQGYEWIRLVHFGLTLSSGTYGATFYTLIGFHALHVLAAVLWLGIVFAQGCRTRFTADGLTGVEICAMS